MEVAMGCTVVERLPTAPSLVFAIFQRNTKKSCMHTCTRIQGGGLISLKAISAHRSLSGWRPCTLDTKQARTGGQETRR